MSDITPKSQRRREKVHHSIVVSSFLLPVGDVSTYGRGTQDPNTAADLLHGGWSGRSVQCRWRYSQSDIVSGRVITSRFLHPVRDGRGWMQEPATAADLLHSSWPGCAVRCWHDMAGTCGVCHCIPVSRFLFRQLAWHGVVRHNFLLVFEYARFSEPCRTRLTALITGNTLGVFSFPTDILSASSQRRRFAFQLSQFLSRRLGFVYVEVILCCDKQTVTNKTHDSTDVLYACTLQVVREW